MFACLQVQGPAFYSFQSINCSDSYTVGIPSVLNIPKTNGWYLGGKKSKIKKKNLLVSEYGFDLGISRTFPTKSHTVNITSSAGQWSMAQLLNSTIIM